MRLSPIPAEALSADLRDLHNEIANLLTRSQEPVGMDAIGALTGAFVPILHYPKFGVPALSFLRSLDGNGSLSKSVREVAILTVGAAYGGRFEIYAHEIKAEAFSLTRAQVATLAACGFPDELSNEESIAHCVARSLVGGNILPESTYHYAVEVLGREGVGELMFLIGGYCLFAVILNGFDVPTP